MKTSMIRSLILLLGLFSLWGVSACSTPTGLRGTAPAAKPLASPIITDQLPGSSFPADGQWQCVPYARAVSGIELYGDAWTWWARAEGKFTRAQTPARGAVLVFARGEKLRLGHLAVVITIKNAREIETTDANWGSAADTRGHVHDEQLIQDVSADNSWHQVRVWNRKAQIWGRPYETYGFIYPPKAWGPPRCALPDGSVGLCPNS